MNKISVKGTSISIIEFDSENYISLTDIARYKDPRTDILISNWLRNRMTIEFLGLWEKINNPNFNHIEFDGIRNKSGLNSFIISVKQWVDKTNSIGIKSKASQITSS